MSNLIDICKDGGKAMLPDSNNCYVIFDEFTCRFVWKFIREDGKYSTLNTQNIVITADKVFSENWIPFEPTILPRAEELWSNQYIKSIVFICNVDGVLKRIPGAVHTEHSLLDGDIPDDMIHGKNGWVREYPEVEDI